MGPWTALTISRPSMQARCFNWPMEPSWFKKKMANDASRH
ncbi:MAG: hypothetical protein QOJ51_6969 [Acidobacteriaceae bacterium]|jgi:hypothetical protein|nr:hypothetical protein [Acidobacteriaceae bacterium]MEA2264144.1 hypothetical protein [Acidobacteriaceae bacterium]